MQSNLTRIFFVTEKNSFPFPNTDNKYTYTIQHSDFYFNLLKHFSLLSLHFNYIHFNPPF